MSVRDTDTHFSDFVCKGKERKSIYIAPF